MEDIIEADLSRRPFTVTSMNGETYGAQTLIIASGATARRLPLASEQQFWGRGISACATCDGSLPIFREKELAVIGGGDTAIEEALHLTRFASKVFLIHRRNELRACKVMQKRLHSHPKIEVLWNKVVEEFLGEKLLTGLRLRDTATGDLSQLNVAGAFEAIGHIPNTRFLKGQVALSDFGYIVTQPGSTRTAIDGLFAAGDVQDSMFRQAVTAAASGCMAAKEVEWWLQDQAKS
jgi:thioredoxin reductase (NADPH)